MFVLHRPSLAYATTTFAATLMNSVFGFYYVKVYLNRFHVNESWFHIAQIIFMIWNAINDPLFGYIQDNYSFSWVKSRRHSILYGAPWFALSFLVTWFPWDPEAKSAWISGLQLLFVLCFYDALFTFVLLAQCALFTEMSRKQEDRLRLIQYCTVASLSGSGTVFFCEKFSNNLQDYHKFQFACVIIAFISWGCMHYTGVNASSQQDKEPTESKHESNDNTNNNSGIVSQTLQILKQRNFLSFVFMNFCAIFANAFSTNFASIFCDRLISSSDLSPGNRSIFYGSFFTLPPLMVLVGAPIIAHFGYYRVIRSSFFITIIMSLFLYVMGPHPYTIILYYCIMRINQAGSFKLLNLCLSDVIDEDQVRYKRSSPMSAMVYGTNALITKPAISIAPMVTVSVLNRYGYSDLKDKTEANPDLDAAIISLMVFVPLVLGFVQLFMWSFFTIRDSHLNDKISVEDRTEFVA